MRDEATAEPQGPGADVEPDVEGPTGTDTVSVDEARRENGSSAADEAQHSSRLALVADILTIFVLSVTAVVTAWCGFQASKWSGEMSIAFSQASTARVQASNAEGMARDAKQLDLSLYTEYVLAQVDNKPALADFVQARFSPELRKAFNAWVAGGRTATGPFAMPEYVPPGTNEAIELSKRADERFALGLINNQRGDNYSLLTVLFALVLFLAAMSQRKTPPWVRCTLLGLAIGFGVLGVTFLATFPIKI